MSQNKPRPRGRSRKPENLTDLAIQIVAEAWNSGLSASEDIGWTRTGSNQQVNRTLRDLDLARNDTRRLLEGSVYDDGNEFAIGASTNRRNYAVGDGLTYEAVPVGEGVESSLVSRCQQFIDAFREINCLDDMASETVWRLDTTGDSIIRLFPGDGIPQARFVEPECVYPPTAGDKPKSMADLWDAWGVVTPMDDHRTRIGYWINKEFVPEREIVHVKLNTDSSCPRGWPTFEPIRRALIRAEELLVAMSATGKARAKLALIEIIPGLTREKGDAIVNQLTTQYQHQPDGSAPKQVSMEELPYGARIRLREGTRVEFPNNNLGAAEMVEAIQANLRTAAQRIISPEWMFTGLADQKYSNSFVAEAPSTKEFKSLQRLLTWRFGGGRYGQEASLVWRAIRMAVESGLLPADTIRLVKVKCTAPSLEVRDKLAEAQTNSVYVGNGTKSRQTVREEIGLDHGEEEKRVAAEIEVFGLPGKWVQPPTGLEPGAGTVPPDQAGSTGATQPDQTQPQSPSSGPTGDTRNSVGGLQAVKDLQIAYFAGQIERTAAIANMTYLFGFPKDQAEAMFPVKQAADLAAPTAPQPNTPPA